MAATLENPIIFYDIVGKDGTHWALNPYKTRLTLNYKGLPYRVKYIKVEDVEPSMKAIGIPATSKTFPQYTLPMIADPSSDPNGKPTYVSESFKIAEYLDEKYPAPNYPVVLPHGTYALQKIFVENYFPSIFMPTYPIIATRVPNIIDEASQEYMYRTRGGKNKFVSLSDEAENELLAETHEKWNAFAQALGEGPWVMSDTVTFADFAIGCGLYFWRRTDGSEGKVWKEVAGWQNGRWAEYWDRIAAIENKSSSVA